MVCIEALDAAPADVLSLPCPPVTRGEEVSVDAMEHDACHVYEAKSWLLPAQAALMERLLAQTSQRQQGQP
jgi:ornithine carbamoyltransferase